MYHDSLKRFIPPQFDLLKYDQAANMQLLNWLENLTMRFLPYLVCQQSLDSLSGQEHKLIQEQVKYNIENGVVLNEKYPEILKAMLENDEAEYASVVRNITYFDLYRMTDLVGTDEYKSLYSGLNKTIFPLLNQNILGKLNDPISIPSIDEENYSWIQVDMNSSNVEIQAAFQAWLKQARPVTGKKKSKNRQINHFNSNAFRNWHDARVLAYLDLVAWNGLNGNKVTAKILGDILFPDPKILADTTRMIPETVKPYADKLTSLVTLRRMINVIASENRKKITQKSS